MDPWQRATHATASVRPKRAHVRDTATSETPRAGGSGKEKLEGDIHVLTAEEWCLAGLRRGARRWYREGIDAAAEGRRPERLVNLSPIEPNELRDTGGRSRPTQTAARPQPRSMQVGRVHRDQSPVQRRPRGRRHLHIDINHFIAFPAAVRDGGRR